LQTTTSWAGATGKPFGASMADEGRSSSSARWFEPNIKRQDETFSALLEPFYAGQQLRIL